MPINIETWFQDRELNHCPKHFTTANTPVTIESKQWILEKLRGRFYIQTGSGAAHNFTAINRPFKITENNIPSFEDPEEATLYELTWS